MTGFGKRETNMASVAQDPGLPWPKLVAAIVCVSVLVFGSYFATGLSRADKDGEVAEVTAGSEITPGSEMWVKSDRLIRRTCPSKNCGVVGQLFHREVATVFEQQDSWVRISKYYDASCWDGRSEYVDEGPAECSAANGIDNGKFAEWAQAENLSATRPADPAANATGYSKLVAGSDDFRLHEKTFAKAARTLIDNGRCSEKDFLDMGGWLKSPSKGAEIYFTYCKSESGNGGVSDRIYLNVKSGRLFV